MPGEGWNAGSWDRVDRKMTAERCRKRKLLSKHFMGKKSRAVSASQLVSVPDMISAVSSGQELYQLSKEKADFSVTAGEEDESTAGSSGENDGNSRSSTPHSSIKSPPSKSPAKAQKAEGKRMVLSGRSLCLGQAGSGSLIPPFTWIWGIMGKAVQILDLAQYELCSCEMSWDWEKMDGNSSDGAVQVGPAPTSAGLSLWCEIVGPEPVFNLIWMEFMCVKGHVAGGDFQVNGAGTRSRLLQFHSRHSGDSRGGQVAAGGCPTPVPVEKCVSLVTVMDFPERGEETSPFCSLIHNQYLDRAHPQAKFLFSESKGDIRSPQKSEEKRGEKRKASEMEDNGKKVQESSPSRVGEAGAGVVCSLPFQGRFCPGSACPSPLSSPSWTFSRG